MTDSYPQLRADERATLEQFLDHYRQVAVEKLDGLDAAQASAHALQATELTVGGIVKHLAHVEDWWFQHQLLGVDLPEPWASAPFEQDPDWDFHSSHHESVDDLRDLYASACERSRAAVARFDALGVTASRPSFGSGPVSLRWILVHMIEETARHAGHADLLRDAIDRTPSS